MPFVVFLFLPCFRIGDVFEYSGRWSIGQSLRDTILGASYILVRAIGIPTFGLFIFWFELSGSGWHVLSFRIQAFGQCVLVQAFGHQLTFSIASGMYALGQLVPWLGLWVTRWPFPMLQAYKSSGFQSLDDFFQYFRLISLRAAKLKASAVFIWNHLFSH